MRDQKNNAADEHQSEPDSTEPTPERQDALRNEYDANVSVGNPPYAGVWVNTLGELQWILRSRNWYGSKDESGRRPDLGGVDLYKVNLKGVNLYRANLSGADLAFANLTNANLQAANLRGARLWGAVLAGADLREVIMDESTRLREIIVDEKTKVGDVGWNNAQLAQIVSWPERLGDEANIAGATSREDRMKAYHSAVRAYGGLARALGAQGLFAPAMRYRRRQYQLERAIQLRTFQLPQWLFSNALNIVSGYGDRPLRAFAVYLAVIVAFASIYFGITTPGSPVYFSGSQPLPVHEALVFSLSSFHGRGFFPSTIGLGDPVAIVAALEAVVGLFIELILIATFTRRLFER